MSLPDSRLGAALPRSLKPTGGPRGCWGPRQAIEVLKLRPVSDSVGTLSVGRKASVYCGTSCSLVPDSVAKAGSDLRPNSPNAAPAGRQSRPGGLQSG